MAAVANGDEVPIFADELLAVCRWYDVALEYFAAPWRECDLSLAAWFPGEPA